MKVADQVRLYELMQKELYSRMRDLEEISQSLMYVKRDLDNQIIDTKKFDEKLEMLDRYRMYIKIKRSNIDFSSNTKDEKINDEELKNLAKITKAVTDCLIEILKSLSPIKTDVEKIKKRASEKLEYNPISEYVYRHSRECLIVIEEISRKICKNLEKGDLHDIVMASSLINAELQILEKNGVKR